MARVYFHVDVNSAFLSWSALKALREGSAVDLRSIPSAVGGDEEKRHGVVLAKSLPAKRFGVRTANRCSPPGPSAPPDGGGAGFRLVCAEFQGADPHFERLFPRH